MMLAFGKSKFVQITFIHKTLYNFTPSKMKAISEVKGYSFLLNHFIKNYKDILLRTNKTIQKSYVDYEAGFEYLKKFHC